MKKYDIVVKDTEGMERAIKALFRRGYVFTESRLTTMDDIKRDWKGCWKDWRVIKVGSSESECKMILHAGGIAERNAIVLSLQKFLKIEKEL